jgi:hypothetical protein
MASSSKDTKETKDAKDNKDSNKSNSNSNSNSGMEENITPVSERKKPDTDNVKEERDKEDVDSRSPGISLSNSKNSNLSKSSSVHSIQAEKVEEVEVEVDDAGREVLQIETPEGQDFPGLPDGAEALGAWYVSTDYV